VPISRGEFESSLDRTAYVILELLRANMDSAYTAHEISDALSAIGQQASSADLDRALAELARRGWTEASTREGELYYAYRRWIGFRR
jgi:hypothetical protein